MGIPHLYKWLRDKNYKAVLQRSVPSYVSSLSLDFNGVLHNTAQIVYAYGEGEDPVRRKLVEKADPIQLEAEYNQVLATKLSEIIAQVRPREVFTIAVDGVAPQAKIAQQRQRRYRAAQEGGNAVGVFSSSVITPGTEFMMRVDNFLQRWIVSAKQTLPPKVIYSSHMVQGEGEHKVLSLMRQKEIFGNGAHVIYGLDADLIMLSLLAPLDNIYLMREDISNVINIDNLREAIREELGSETAIQDFVVMIYLLGNDFLPHIVSLADLDEAIETMMRTYIQTGVNLTDDEGILWPNMAKYLTELGREEQRLLEMESMRDVKHPSRMMGISTTKSSALSAGGVKNTSSFNHNTFRSAWYQNAFALKGKQANIFQKLLPQENLAANNDKIVEMVRMYLTGMSWVYRYYSKGLEFVNNDFVYRYHYAPLISDIGFLAQRIGEPNFKIFTEDFIFNHLATEVNPVHQLLAVIPPHLKEILPDEVKHLTRTDSIIADYFPIGLEIERDGYNTDWQGVTLINFVDMRRILDAVNRSCIFSEARAHEFSPVHNIILKKDVSALQIDEKTRKFREYLSKEDNKGRGRGRGRGQSGRGRGESGRGRGDSGRGRGRGQGRGRGAGTRTSPQPRPQYQVPQPTAPSIYKPLPVQRFEL